MKKFPFVPELFKIAGTYNVQSFLKDLSAGIIVGVVALPLAIAFGIASGVSPANGLFTAIVAGFIISFFGGSRVQIGGPTGAFSVIVFGIVAEYGMNGLAVATMLAGIMLIALGLLKLGDLIKFVPYTIVVGFTAGIAVVIATGQIGDFFGLETGEMPADFIGKIKVYASVFSGLDVLTTGVAIASLILIFLWQKIPVVGKKIPPSLVVIIIATVATRTLNLPLDTIGSRYGQIPSALPSPTFPEFDFQLIRDMFSPAMSIALLCAIESLLSAMVADGMINARHDSNTELVAQGLANLASPIFGGIPATGAIARTATNINNGGRTPVAGIIHALVVLLIMMVFGQFASLIPLCVLSAILMTVAYNMAGFSTIRHLLYGQKSDMTVFLVSFFLTVFIDLTVAIEIGLLLAAFFFIQKAVRLMTVKPFNIPSLNNKIAVLKIYGSVFFGTASKVEQAISELNDDFSVLVLDMRDALYVDAAGIHTFEQLYDQIRHRGKHLFLTNLTDQPKKLFSRHNLSKMFPEGNFSGNLEKAIMEAEHIIEKSAK